DRRTWARSWGRSSRGSPAGPTCRRFRRRYARAWKRQPTVAERRSGHRGTTEGRHGRVVIPQAFIQDLLARVDIVDVVGHSVKLKKAGTNFLGLCPFHGEKTPSFTVSPSKQFYHCFGCGAHGTAIGFLMEHGGLGY